jgi:hypothetical protein
VKFYFCGCDTAFVLCPCLYNFHAGSLLTLDKIVCFVNMGEEGESDALWLAIGRGCSHNWLLGGIQSEFLDIYNATSNSWTGHPAGLGQARSSLAAASLPSGLVFFAGGFTGATKRMFALQLRHVHFCESLYVLA